MVTIIFTDIVFLSFFVCINKEQYIGNWATMYYITYKEFRSWYIILNKHKETQSLPLLKLQLVVASTLWKPQIEHFISKFCQKLVTWVNIAHDYVPRETRVCSNIGQPRLNLFFYVTTIDVNTCISSIVSDLQ